MSTTVRIDELKEGRALLCREILDDLADWFGISEAKEAYIAGCSDLPMIAAWAADIPVGLVSLKRVTEFSAELYVLGVKRRFHRQGIGRALVDAAVEYANAQKMAFLTVKTLAPSNPDPHYAATRAFYEAVGFLPVEVFPTLWDARNPCLLMIRPLN